MSPARRLLHYFRRHRLSLLLGGLCVAGSALFSLLKPLIVGKAVDLLSFDFDRSVLIKYSLLFVGAALIEGIFLYLQRSIVIGASRRIEYDMRGDFYDHLQNLPLRFYHQQKTGDLMSRATNDLSSVRMLIGPAVMHSFSSLLVVIGAFVMMLRLDLQLATISLISIPIVAWMVQFFGNRIHLLFKDVQDHFGDISARVQENLSGMRVVRAFAQERNEIELFKKMNREYVDRNRSLIRLTATFYPLLHAIIGVMFVIVFYLGSRKMLAGSMTIGSFVAFQFYLGRMIWPLIALGWVINLFQRGMASMKRLTEIWNEKADVEVSVNVAEVTRSAAQLGTDNQEGSALPAPGPEPGLWSLQSEFGRPGSFETDYGAFTEGSISIRNLSFGYGEREVLHNIDLDIESGQTVGIVGRTGSGKSTLLALLARMYQPPPGSIFINGTPIEEIPVSELRKIIGMVPQETFLFSESVAENIRFGRGTATRDEIEHVAAMAGLSSDLSAFPKGVETVVGERGITLSGGQKQRTAIARAIIRNPAILILDDSLSAVDTQTEERILTSLRTVRRGRTVLIVSHRVSSVKDSDLIVVIEDGSIRERGTHEQLLAHGGYYAELYARQTLEAEIEEIA